MDKRVILGVAGSGKTYYICNNIDPKKRNLILAYTNENVKNLYKELLKSQGEIPKDTIITTFHSFLYSYLIRPFDRLIGDFYGVSDFESEGVTFIEPPLQSLPYGKYRRPNPNYYNIHNLKHYHTHGKYYCSYLAKLILKTNSKNNYSLLNSGLTLLNRFFDYIYIDEFQDFRKEEYSLIVEIIKNFTNIVLVGDYFQHSVNAKNNSGIPFKANNNPITYDSYLDLLKSIGLTVDTTSLQYTRRCPEKICKFIRDKLKISISIANDNNNLGEVSFVSDYAEIDNILKDNRIVKLVWKHNDAYNFNYLTWGYSKGDTFSSVCVILTDSFEDISEDNFIAPNNTSLNKLYVALTRTKGNLYLIKKTDLDSYYRDH